ncbi:4-hydroxythreonine-4-phosphate dehydrogenase PdxA [Haliangium sp.]|uniref:4-hydroxythreonine-4-phosphate dehydrogenase PdxA n=1 Tax=Haliangium sp. TaxID=2663208 RepID=UPI003D133711
MNKDRRIGITLGDPAGVGPEIVAAAVAGADSALRARLMVFCDRPILDRAFAQVTGGRPPTELEVIDRDRLSPDQAVPGQPTAASAEAQVAYLEAAVAAARGGTIAGLVTAPISKRAARRAGFSFPGHTEFLAERLRAPDVAMMFAGPTLKVVLASVHMALREVPAALTQAGLVRTIELAATALERDFGAGGEGAPVRVGVLGLNPHAGEQGLFGREELEVITPAIEEARRLLDGRAEVSGPLIPDAAFRHAAAGSHDVLIAMYHDQGLIPVKLLDFEQAVNVTLGLPIVRTSPDHGVAYDVAGTGQARPQSFMAALALADELVARRADSA